jgi:hypothetical protein
LSTATSCDPAANSAWISWSIPVTEPITGDPHVHPPRFRNGACKLFGKKSTQFHNAPEYKAEEANPSLDASCAIPE